MHEVARVPKPNWLPSRRPPNVVELLLNIADVYARKVAALLESLAAAQVGEEVFEQFRALITKVVLTPKADGWREWFGDDPARGVRDFDLHMTAFRRGSVIPE